MAYIAIFLAIAASGALVTSRVYKGRYYKMVAEEAASTDRYGKDRSQGVLAVARGNLIGAGVGYGLAVLFLAGSTLVVIDAGEVGVPVLFGEVGGTLTEGLNLKHPFASVVKMPIRTVESTFTAEDDGGKDSPDDAISAFSAENALVDVDITLLWHINPIEAGNVYRTVGKSYREVLVQPITRSATRDCVAMFAFDEARTTKRGEVSRCILEAMQAELSVRGLVVESVQLRGMRADATLQAAIERKLEAANAVQEAEFRRQQAEIDKESTIIQAEAVRDATIIKAEGEANANREIADSLTDSVLQLRIIEALGDKALVFTGGGGPAPVFDVSGLLPTETGN